MRELVEGALSIQARTERRALVLAWSGVSTDPHPERVLGAYLDEAKAEAARLAVPLELRFEDLDYCNSATLAMVADFIQRWDRPEKLVCVFDDTRRWQRLSLDALRVFESDQGSFELRTTAG